MSHDGKYIFNCISGRTKRDILFEMGSNTDMTGACSFNLNNQNYIIGGKDHRRQVQLNKIII